MIEVVSKAFLNTNHTMRGPLNLVALLLPKYRPAFFSTAFALNSSAPEPESKENIYDSEPDTHDFSFFGGEEKVKSVAGNKAILTKVANNKNLGSKDLDWISSKIKGVKKLASSSKGLARSDSNVSQITKSAQTQLCVHTNPLKKNSGFNSLEKFINKWIELTETRESKCNFSQHPDLTHNGQETSKQLLPLVQKLPVPITRALIEKIRYLAKENPEQYDLSTISVEYNIPYEMVRQIIGLKLKSEVEIDIKSDCHRGERLGYSKSFEEDISASQLAANVDPNAAPFSVQSLQKDSSLKPPSACHRDLKWQKRFEYLKSLDPGFYASQSAAKIGSTAAPFSVQSMQNDSSLEPPSTCHEVLKRPEIFKDSKSVRTEIRASLSEAKIDSTATPFSVQSMQNDSSLKPPSTCHVFFKSSKGFYLSKSLRSEIRATLSGDKIGLTATPFSAQSKQNDISFKPLSTPLGDLNKQKRQLHLKWEKASILTPSDLLKVGIK